MTDHDHASLTLIDNQLDVPYSALYHATHAGSEFDTLAALREMVAVVPEIGEWLAREVGTSLKNINVALEWQGDAVGFDDFDPADAELLELDALLDSAAAFGTLEDVLDDLIEEDPKAGTAIAKHYGMGSHQAQEINVIAADLGRSREMVRRYVKRGREKMRTRLEARGRTTT